MAVTNRRKMTIGFIIAASLAVLAYDLWIAGAPTGDTISEVVLSFAGRGPVRGFLSGLAVGFFLGHLFWPQRIPSQETPKP